MSDQLENQIDREYLADISGGDSEFEQELIGAFVKSAGSLVEDLEAALAERSVSAVRHASHTLKGSSRAIGANPFSEVCEVIELAAREGNLEACGQNLASLKESFAILGEACQQFLAEAA